MVENARSRAFQEDKDPNSPADKPALKALHDLFVQLAQFAE
jgi:hypothetical protein